LEPCFDLAAVLVDLAAVAAVLVDLAAVAAAAAAAVLVDLV
jgi:hypothetical protein